MLTVAQLRRVMPSLPLPNAERYLPHLLDAMREFGITTRLRVCAFLAQIAHETSDLKYQQELWGPTPAQRRYDTRVDLGNTPGLDGDGYRYRGRGALQLTGAANYRSVGKALGIDLFADPDRADDPDVSFRIAGYYWQSHHLNKLADQLRGVADKNEVKVNTAITKVINGGHNGLEDRIVRYSRALKAIPADGYQSSVFDKLPDLAPETVSTSPQGAPVTSPAGTLTDSTSTQPPADVTSKFKELVSNDAVRAKATDLLPHVWRILGRPFLLLEAAYQAHSVLTISLGVLAVPLLVVFAYLHRNDLKRLVHYGEDLVRQYFLKQT